MQPVKEGTMGFKLASATYQVPRTTLQRRVHGRNTMAMGTVKYIGGKQPILPAQLEDELVSYVVKMEEMLFGLTLKDLQKLAFQITERNNIKHTFSVVNQEAGYDWLKGFLRRHPTLSIRSPEATSAAGAWAFNRVSVEIFFDLLESIQDQKHFLPSRISNVDETGMTTVQGKPSKIIALRGRKQVGSLTSAERGQLCTTEILCMSASGQFVPPMIIFPRLQMKLELMDGTPPASVYHCHPSG